MLKDAKFVVATSIPLDKDGNHSIPKGTEITITHGCFYMNGGLLPKDYQEDFEMLVNREMKTGWKYLLPDNPIVGKSIISKTVNKDDRDLQGRYGRR